jgi:hypothetical protein
MSEGFFMIATAMNTLQLRSVEDERMVVGSI